MVDYFSKKLSDTEQDYTANERELLGLVYFLKRFRCYLEGSSFEVITDNQGLYHFFTNPHMGRKEARWLDLLSQFSIKDVSLKPGRVHVLVDVLSRAPHVIEGLEVTNMQVSIVSLDLGFEAQYASDQLFGPVSQAREGDFPSDEVHKDRIERLLPKFKTVEGLLYYEDKVCVPRSCVRDVLQLAHDSKLGGHFGFAKTLARVQRFHWKGRTKDVRQYCEGCITCQQQGEMNTEKLGDPVSHNVPTRRWGCIATDFIVGLPLTKQGFDAITTWVDRLSRRVRLIPSKTSDTAEDTARSFMCNIFPIHGLPDSIASDRDPKFTSKFWRSVMQLCKIKLQMSSSHHPETDGISEVMNHVVEKYLRCYCSFLRED